MVDAQKIDIRDARDDERGAVRDLTLAAYAPYASIMVPSAWAGLDSAVRAALQSEREDVHRIVAIQDERIVGSVFLYPPATDAYGEIAGRMEWPELRLLAVADEARGYGVGRALVAECVYRAREMGASALGLHTSKSMQDAIRMYERMGFERTPEHDFQPEGAERVTAYSLPLDPEIS